MMNLNTSGERVDALVRLSGPLYEAIDTDVSGVTRAQQTLTLGINSVGFALRHGMSLDDAGSELLAIHHEQLNRAGLPIDHPVFDAWPNYQEYIQSLPKPSLFKETSLNHFATAYGAVERGTRDDEGAKETNARHAVHLMGWAVPYAMQFYPKLNPNRTAVKALFHDGIEVITGDKVSITLSDTDHAQKVLDEHAALPLLGLMIGPEDARLFKVIRDYEELRKREDRFVKTADKAAPAFTHFRNDGYTLWQHYGIGSAEEFLARIQKVTERMAPYSHEFPQFMTDRDEIHRRVASITKWPH